MRACSPMPPLPSGGRQDLSPFRRSAKTCADPHGWLFLVQFVDGPVEGAASRTAPHTRKATPATLRHPTAPPRARVMTRATVSCEPTNAHIPAPPPGDRIGGIYRSVVEAIVSGRLRPGDRLPPSRRLAEELGVARVTVTSAYERLVAEGYLEGRVGA